ncbi:peptidylprolyl isomerase [Ovoidimarina sediminis]|uniref:peptidylprolyl isomerase n=1 Tax=Ovoidimarina sediminis TaxID=3079856 RepID=UPI0029084E13|nr:peptidylprolyl isomerase [Rhodophyticola sp. MJ-SS7]MDU8944281.1 peptidylprolyl isomerase [Rhodophyticola sp. MJ-SS7]
MNLRGILHSPLFHFFALGALIFIVFAALEDEPTAAPPGEIILTEQDASRLVQQFTATWNREPTRQELDGLMRSWALEEANVREALALGLDRGDAVIRQRLNQKIRFLAESGAAALEANDAILQSYLDEAPERFLQPARIAFDQIMLPPDAAVDEVRAALESGAAPSELGSPSLLPPSVPITPAPIIDRTFGERFHEALVDLPKGRWEGPVKSGYGQHLVRVTDRTDAFLPPLSEIRDRVEAEWRALQMREMRETFGQALLDRYSVTLPDAEKVLNQ